MDAAGVRVLEERARHAGRRAFGTGWQPTRIAIAPGRVELIGNHTDYNGGPVLCAAIDRWIVILADDDSATEDIRLIGADISRDEGRRINPRTSDDWHAAAGAHDVADYVQGAVAAIGARPGMTVQSGTRMAIAGDVPLGFGLSSSAALCVATTLVIGAPQPTPRELVLLAQEAEHRAGTPCGRMDQSASVHGGVIRFDGRTTESERRSPHLGNLVFAVMDSGVSRALSDSAYPVRVQEAAAACIAASSVLRKPISGLAEITPNDLQELERSPAIEATLLQRIRHIVTETERVNLADVALQAADWEAFGALMDASGRSSATDYAISHPRVEQLVAEARAVPGVLGARMMGGGEGGAAICLLPRESLPQLEATLSAGYFREFGMAGRSGLVQPCAFSEGATLQRV